MPRKGAIDLGCGREGCSTYADRFRLWGSRAGSAFEAAKPAQAGSQAAKILSRATKARLSDLHV